MIWNFLPAALMHFLNKKSPDVAPTIKKIKNKKNLKHVRFINKKNFKYVATFYQKIFEKTKILKHVRFIKKI